MISPLDFLKLVIGRWEGRYSNNASDAGNWINGRNIGSMYGVTGPALAAHRGVDATTLTVADMQSVTLDEAAEIGLMNYYHGPRFDLLTWGAATAALVDFGWGAGPGQAIKSMQRLVGAPADGGLGPVTAAAYNGWLVRVGLPAALEAIRTMRRAFYLAVANAHPEDQQFLQGWCNRADWASASNPTFWNGFSTSTTVVAPPILAPLVEVPPPVVTADFAPPPGYVQTQTGNIIRADISQSTIVQGANHGAIIATVSTAATAATAAAPLFSTDWKVLAVFGSIGVAAGILAIVYLLLIKGRRITMHMNGIA